jgi:TIR domain/Transcriptional regulator, AbiEi antitoxin
MTVAEGGGVFVSYRRHETGHLAGRLYDRLVDRFGEGRVFIDVDTIEPGVDFTEEISRAVATCKVLLAIIGPKWLTATDERGRRRLDDPDDIVRLEIEAALGRDVRVIPILAEGAVMPSREDLPESLAGLARRNALAIRHESFRYDAGHLVTAIERTVGTYNPAYAEERIKASRRAPEHVRSGERSGIAAMSRTDAIVAILSDGGTEMSIKDVVAALQDAGRDETNDNVGSDLAYLTQQGRVARIRRGVYAPISG